MSKKLIGIIAASALAAVSLQASAYTVDGDMSDWGLGFTGNASDWTPNSGVEFTTEDQTGGSGAYLNPGYGGQVYDAEAIYVDWDSSYFYYAVVTGLPENGMQYPAGDIAFDFGANGSYELGIETLTTSSVDNNGHTSKNGVDYSAGTQGGLYDVSSWSHAVHYTSADPVQIAAGTLLDTGDLVYSSTAVTNLGQYSSDGHYVIEGRIAMSNFSAYLGQDFNVHWTMNCGNDEIILTGSTLTPESSIPAPGTVGLIGLAMLGMAGVVRRRRK